MQIDTITKTFYYKYTKISVNNSNLVILFIVLICIGFINIYILSNFIYIQYLFWEGGLALKAKKEYFKFFMWVYLYIRYSKTLEVS